MTIQSLNNPYSSLYYLDSSKIAKRLRLVLEYYKPYSDFNNQLYLIANNKEFCQKLDIAPIINLCNVNNFDVNLTYQALKGYLKTNEAK